MRILWLNNELLYPLNSGGQIRTFNLIKELSKKNEIAYFCYSNLPEEEEALRQMEKLCQPVVTLPLYWPNKFTFGFYFALFRNLFFRLPYAVSKYYSSRMKRELQCYLRKNKFDLMICDFLSMSPNVTANYNCPAILFEHNIEHIIWQRRFKNTPNIFKKAYFFLQWIKMYRYEMKKCKGFAHVIVVSEKDKELLTKCGNMKHVSVVQTGVDINYFAPISTEIVPHSLVFTGAMDWMPNEDAIKYFVTEIFPLIRKKVQDVTLYIVGRNPTEDIIRLEKNDTAIKVTGTVDDIRPYIARGSIYIVPLRIGGGTRLKIFEAMAMGKAIVSTAVGAEGLPVAPGENIIIADNPPQFSQGIIELFKDDSLRQRLGKKARTLVEKRYSWKEIAKDFEDICATVIANYP